MSIESNVSTKTHRNLFKKYTSCLSGLLGRRESGGDMKRSLTSIKPGVLVYGGSGLLGSKCIYQLKINDNCWVVSIDHTINIHADVNILIGSEDSVTARRDDILTAVDGAMGSYKFDAILCLSEEGVCGDAESDLIVSMDEMYKTNIQSSLICTTIAAAFLKRGGLFVLSGSRTGISPTPEMLVYGMSKAAVHNLVKSLAKKQSGMPPEAVVIGILPVILEGPISTLNRRSITSESSVSMSSEINFMSLQYVTDLIVKWVERKDVPPSGTLCQINPDDDKYSIHLY